MSFGLTTNPTDRLLSILNHLEQLEIYKFSYLDRLASFRYTYKKEYGLIDEESLSATEFGLITMSDKTNGLHTLNPRAKRIRMFKQLEVNKYYGLSLIEFLSLDRATCDLIMEELENDAILAARLADAKERELKQAERNSK